MTNEGHTRPSTGQLVPVPETGALTRHFRGRRTVLLLQQMIVLTLVGGCDSCGKTMAFSQEKGRKEKDDGDLGLIWFLNYIYSHGVFSLLFLLVFLLLLLIYNRIQLRRFGSLD